MARSIRGKRDFVNGAIAGCAAGSVVGLRAGSVLMSGGACAAFAAMSAFVETVGFDSVNDYTTRRRKAVYGVTDEE